jgi:hypothetical protein
VPNGGANYVEKFSHQRVLVIEINALAEGRGDKGHP